MFPSILQVENFVDARGGSSEVPGTFMKAHHFYDIHIGGRLVVVHLEVCNHLNHLRPSHHDLHTSCALLERWYHQYQACTRLISVVDQQEFLDLLLSCPVPAVEMANKFAQRHILQGARGQPSLGSPAPRPWTHNWAKQLEIMLGKISIQHFRISYFTMRKFELSFLHHQRPLTGMFSARASK